MLRIHFRFRGMADMAGLAVGLTQSRLTPSGLPASDIIFDKPSLKLDMVQRLTQL
jgi:hypothetical protein